MIQVLSNYRPRLYHCLTHWKKPETGRIKINTDGASKGNPGLSSYGFCLRNDRGDLLYAEAGQIGENTQYDHSSTKGSALLFIKR